MTIPTRILVVDVDPASIELLQGLLRNVGYEVRALTAPTEAMYVLTEQVFGLIILDPMLPGVDGLDLCHGIRTISGAPIIVVSARGEVQDKIRWLKAGADDYIIKPFDPNEVLTRTWATLRRNVVAIEPILNMKTADLILTPDDNEVALVRNGKTVSLTPIEARLLRCLGCSPGRTLTREALMIKVWGYEYEGESNQLDVYIKRLRSKIEENPSEPKLLLTIRGVGYMFKGVGYTSHSSVLPRDLDPGAVEAEGKLEPQGQSCSLYGRYLLLGEHDRSLFALASDAVGLDAFIGRQVRVRGYLVPGYPFAGGPPYLYVTEVQEIEKRRGLLALQVSPALSKVDSA